LIQQVLSFTSVFSDEALSYSKRPFSSGLPLIFRMTTCPRRDVLLGGTSCLFWVWVAGLPTVSWIFW